MTTRSTLPTDPGPSHGGRRSFLMGRAGEMRVIDDAFAAAQKTRSCRTVTVMGAAGVGKSRLVSEFLVRVTAGSHGDKPARAFSASAKGATEDGGLFGRLFKSRFELTGDVDRDAAKALVTAELTAVLGDRKIGDCAHCLGPYFGLDFPDSPLVRAISREAPQLRVVERAVIRHFWESDALAPHAAVFVEGAKPPKPLVLVFEDMHAATDDELDLLAMLVESVHAPVLIVCVARPDLTVRREDWLTHGDARHIELALMPLGETEAAAFMHELLSPCGEDPAIDDLVDAAVTLAAGNPSLLEQVVRIFRDTGVLETATSESLDTERWVIRAEMLESVHIPLSVEDAVQARIAGLSTTERTLLERAATMGGVFWFGGLLAIQRQEGAVPEIWSPAASDDGAAIRTTLAELVERDYLLKLPDSTFPGDDEYVFKHNLEREALVKLTSARARQRYHGVIADWLTFKENVSSHADSLAMLAQHREKSGAKVPTVRAYFLAADVARAHHEHSRANEYYQKGFALIREGAAVELDVRLSALHDHGDVLQSLGRHDEARASFREMLERSYRLDVRAKGGAAHARTGRLCRDTGRLEDAERHLRAALALFDQTADDRGVASTTDDLGKLYWVRGDYGKALDYGERGLAMRRAIGDKRSIALSLNNLGLVYQDSGQFKKALESFEQALAIRREIGDRVGIGQSLNNLGSVAQDCREDSRALSLFTEAYDIAKETGDKNRLALYLTNIGETHNRLGAADTAVTVLRQAEELADELGDRLLLAETLRGLGKAYLTLRQFTHARECAARAVELFREVESKVQVGVALRSLGEVMAAASAGGDSFAQACEHVLQSIATFEEIGNDIELARSCRSYAQILRVSPDFGQDPGVEADAARHAKRADEILAKLTISVRGFEPEAFFSPK